MALRSRGVLRYPTGFLKKDRIYLLLMKLKPTREKVLKCNGCTACCRGPNRILYLDPRQELDHLSTTKVNYKGIELLILDMEENGDCIYLKDNKCSIF